MKISLLEMRSTLKLEIISADKRAQFSTGLATRNYKVSKKDVYVHILCTLE